MSLQSRHLFTLFITLHRTLELGQTPAGDRRVQRSLFERLLTIIGFFDLQMERRRSRLALLQLTDAQLNDIGLSRREIDGKIYQRSGIDHTDAQ